MKSVFLIIFLFTLSLFNAIGQVALEHDRENLAKYWYYKDRFNHEFIKLNEPWTRGACIPASIRRTYLNGNSENIQFGDATIDLGYYIGVLATEYSLLHNSGQDVTQTTKDLFWAIWALDRLDLFAEGIWMRIDPAGSGYQTMNGFFVRDDVGADLFTNGSQNSSYLDFLNSFNRIGALPVNNIISDYVNYRVRNNPINIEESKDQVAHLMVGLCLVLQLVPGGLAYIENGIPMTYNMSSGYSSIQAQARYFLRKVFDHIHPPSANWNYFEWIINNPVNGPVNIGNNLWTWAPGLSAMYQRFFGVPNPDPNFLDFLDFGSILEHIACNIQWWAQIYTYDVVFGSSSNGRLQGIMSLNFQLLSGYEFRPPSISTKAIDESGPYYQIPLLAKVMNGTGIMPPAGGSFFHCTAEDYRTLLEEAPCFGPYYHNAIDVGSYNFSTTSLLVHPERRMTGSFPGDYNGLDYMFLHNLNLLAFHSPSTADMKNLYRTTVNETMPWNRNGCLGQGNAANPIEIPSFATIDANNIIHSSAHVSYRAGESITLNPGFIAESGATFLAYIDDITCEPRNKNDLQRININLDQNSSKNYFSECKNDSFILYPTVSDAIIFIQNLNSNLQKFKYTIKSVSGQIVFEDNNIDIRKGQSEKIDISAFKSGIYFCSIYSENFTKTFKFIKAN